MAETRDRPLRGRHFMVQDREIHVQASIGIAFNQGTEDPSELIQAADVAMYAAKARGKDGTRSTNPPCRWPCRAPRADGRPSAGGGRTASSSSTISPSSASRVARASASRRWSAGAIPSGARCSPQEFIPLAEETGLIVPLGRWVLMRPASRRAGGSASREAAPLRLSVNISARHFQHDSLVDDVSEALRDSEFDPACLVLEITESVLVQDADTVIPRMLALKELGVSFAIDDFGTGYSSLSYLKRFPIDILKVDKSFVDDVVDSAKPRPGRGHRPAGQTAPPDRGRGHREGPPVRRPEGARLPVRPGVLLCPARSGAEHGPLPPLMSSGALVARANAAAEDPADDQRTTGGPRPGPNRERRPIASANRRGADSRWGDLERLRASHPMMDAVIDEVQGRRIRMAITGCAISPPATISALTCIRPSSSRWSLSYGGGAPTPAGPGCWAAPAPTSTSKSS